jgi:hypothetical protein
VDAFRGIVETSVLDQPHKYLVAKGNGELKFLEETEIGPIPWSKGDLVWHAKYGRCSIAAIDMDKNERVCFSMTTKSPEDSTEEAVVEGIKQSELIRFYDGDSTAWIHRNVSPEWVYGAFNDVKHVHYIEQLSTELPDSNIAAISLEVIHLLMGMPDVVFRSQIVIPALIQSRFLQAASTTLSGRSARELLPILYRIFQYDGLFLLDRQYHVFISTGSIKHAEFAKQLCKELTQNQIAVYLDLSSLEIQTMVGAGLMAGLGNTVVFVPLVSEASVTKLGLYSIDQPGEPEHTDTTVLEWTVAIELHRKGVIKSILPILMGKPKTGGGRSNIFHDGSICATAEISPPMLREDCRRVLCVMGEYEKAEALDKSFAQTCTIADVLQTILGEPGIDLSTYITPTNTDVEEPITLLDAELSGCVSQIMQRVEQCVQNNVDDEHAQTRFERGCLDVLLDIVVNGHWREKSQALGVLMTAATNSAAIIYTLVQRLHNNASILALQSLQELLQFYSNHGIGQTFAMAGGFEVGLSLLGDQNSVVCEMVHTFFEALIMKDKTNRKQHLAALIQSGAIKVALSLIASSGDGAMDMQYTGLCQLNLLMHDTQCAAELETDIDNLRKFTKILASTRTKWETKDQVKTLLRSLTNRPATVATLAQELSSTEEFSTAAVIALCAIMYTGPFLIYKCVQTKRKDTGKASWAKKNVWKETLDVRASPKNNADIVFALPFKVGKELEVDDIHDSFVRLRPEYVDAEGYSGPLKESCWCDVRQSDGVSLLDTAPSTAQIWTLLEALEANKSFVPVLLQLFDLDAPLPTSNIIHILMRLHRQNVKGIPWGKVVHTCMTTVAAAKDTGIVSKMMQLVTDLLVGKKASGGDLKQCGALPVLLSQAIINESKSTIILKLIRTILHTYIQSGLIVDDIIMLVHNIRAFSGTDEQSNTLKQLRILFASGDIKKIFVDAGGVDVLLELLNAEKDSVQSDIQPIIDELASDETYKGKLVACGLMDVVVSLLHKNSNVNWTLQLILQVITDDVDSARVLANAKASGREGAAVLVTMYRSSKTQTSENVIRSLISSEVVVDFIRKLVQQLVNVDTQLSALVDLDVLFGIGNVKDELMLTGGIEHLLEIMRSPSTKRHEQLARSILFTTVRFALVQGDM